MLNTSHIYIYVCVSPSQLFKLTLFFLLRLLDSSSSSTADEAQSPASFFHSSPLSPSFPLDTTPALSPSHPAFLLPSPASSSSSSYSLHCGAPEPDSPTGSSSSGGSVVVSEASVRFSMLQTGSFSAQVKNVFTFDVIVSATLTLFPLELYIYEVVNNETILFFYPVWIIPWITNINSHNVSLSFCIFSHILFCVAHHLIQLRVTEESVSKLVSSKAVLAWCCVAVYTLTEVLICYDSFLHLGFYSSFTEVLQIHFWGICTLRISKYIF